MREHLDHLRRTAERGLSIANRRDKVFVDVFQHMLDELERASIEGVAHGMTEDEAQVRYPEDCRRIQAALQIYGGEQHSLAECERLWETHNDGMAANLMRLPEDDEELAACVSRRFREEANEHDISRFG